MKKKTELVGVCTILLLLLLIPNVFGQTDTSENLQKAKDSFPRTMHIHRILCI